MKRIRKPLTPMDDKMFKNIIKTKGGLIILKEIISNVINEEIEEIILLNPELKVPNVYVRGKTVDVLVESSNKKIFVEVNNTNDDETRIRNMAYLATKYSNDIKVGQKYEQIDYFYQINLSRRSLSGNLEDEYEMRNKEGRCSYVNNLKIIEYDIEKIFKSKYNEDISDKMKYLAVMMCNSEELNMMSERNEKIKMFKEELDKINSDEYYSDWLTQEEEDEKWLNTWVSKAEKQNTIRIAKNMLNMNVDRQIISKSTGLSLDEVEDLLNDNQS